MKNFKNKKAAKEYAQRLSKTGFEMVKVDDKKVICCGTCIPYDDEFYNFAEEMLEKFGIKDVDTADVRNKLITAFEKACDITFVNGFETF